MGEQRYKAVMAVLSDGRTVTEVARDWEVSRQTMHAWLARYEREGMEAIYRCLLRAGLIQPAPRRWRRKDWKRWERGAPMELWQLDVVGGFHLADGSTAKALTGVDDHSRFCVSAGLMHRERTSKVCESFSVALRKYGVPDQVLTDNGKVFTGRFAQPPVEVLFDRICRDNGIEHILTQPRSPTTTGKIEAVPQDAT